MKTKRVPNYPELNDARRMGPKLRALVESQLIEDLKHYKVSSQGLKFDWSESSIEGHPTDHLDGSVENFGGILVFNSQDDVIAEGWMEFIHEGDFFLSYWEFIEAWDGEKKVGSKDEVGIPSWIWEQLPESTRPKYKAERL